LRGRQVPGILSQVVRAKVGGSKVTMQPDQPVILPACHARGGWDERVRDMAERGDDRLLDEPIRTQWDTDEWEW